MRSASVFVCLLVAACATESRVVPQTDVVGEGDDPTVDLDPCSAADHPDLPDQDLDGLLDDCDCANDNQAVQQPSPDLDTSPRDYGSTSCAADEVMVGVYVDVAAWAYIDGVGAVCGQRCDPAVTRDFGAEGTDAVQRYSVECPTGEVVLGVAWREAAAPYPNDFLEAVTVVCGPAADPDSAPAPAEDPDFDASTDPIVQALCPPGHTAAGTARKDSPVDSNSSDKVDGITMLCQEGRWP